MVTASMLRAMEPGAPLKTFSVGYVEDETAPSSELHWARRVAAALGTQHREVLVNMAEARDALPRIVWHLDEPVADPACVPLYFLARRAKEEVTVVLSGEGADEVLGGYTIYQRLMRVERLREAIGPALSSVARLGRLLPWARARHLCRLIEGPLEHAYRGVSRAFEEGGRARLLRFGDLPPVGTLLAPHWEPTRGLSPLRRMLYLDTRVWLPDDLLVKADKMTMAHAVELRVPLLDHQLVEHIWSLPDSLKVKGYIGKYILRKAARGRVPPFVLEREKLGFSTPTAAWLRGGLYGLAREALLGTRSITRDRFHLPYVRSLLERHRRGADFSTELWPLVILELWHASFARRRPTRETVPERHHAAS
jgi:asparagine synthase (glutamine-hydrolysing)